MSDNAYHLPVLLAHAVTGLHIQPEGVYVDVTFGGGGHSREILKNLGTGGQLIAFDQDPEARKNAIEAPNFELITANFRYMSNHLKIRNITAVDGILADLGVSSFQFDTARRGFSIRSEARLDMRMDVNNPLDAYTVVNTYDEQRLTQVFRLYGEVKNARAAAQKIVAARAEKEISTTTQLLSVLEPLATRGRENKFFAQIFQALRIEVNAELEALESFLLQCEKLLKPGGRLVVISYHSLEDRVVKHFVKTGNLEGKLEKDFYGNPIRPFRPVFNKPIVPNEAEIELNNRARSAKMRIAEKL